jgi:predicted dehydrogenase
MSSRRAFLGQVATSLGGLASVPRNVLGANDRIRVGTIGYGDRGSMLSREAAACPGTHLVAACDVYTSQLERTKAELPGVKTFADHRQMLDDQSIDAVLIASPPHLHCQHFVDAIKAGKHVYQEKTMAFTLEHAKRMRAAYVPFKKKLAVQIGHQCCSFGHVDDALHFLAGDKLGRITAINAAMYRNTPHGRPQWSRPVYPDMTPENIAWDKFLGEAPAVAFDAMRFRNWRFFWDYSGGNIYENMCHQASFWYKVLKLQIPAAVTTTGGLYLWRDGREVPDTMTVAMEQPEDLLFTWHSGLGNSNLGMTESLLGTDGTIARAAQIRYWPEKVNRPQSNAMLGAASTPPRAHMQNFLDCARSGNETNCPFDLGFRVSVACRMAVDSYRQRRTVYWDSEAEQMV